VTAHPRIETPFNEYLEYLETGLWLIGTTLVLSSSYRLGWIGLWHGRCYYATPSYTTVTTSHHLYILRYY